MENDAMSMYWFSAVRVPKPTVGDIRVSPDTMRLWVRPDAEVGKRTKKIAIACMEELGYILLA